MIMNNKDKKRYSDPDVSPETWPEGAAEEMHEQQEAYAPVSDSSDDGSGPQDSGEIDEIGRLKNELEAANEAVAKEKKEYLFLMAEFDNFRKRTLKEKSEIIKNAGEQVLKGLLPIIDDFERGLKATEESDDAVSVREGMELIYNKFVKYLEQNGVKAIDVEDKDFDTEKHEAISAVPVADESLKGKILDTVQKGYTINGKVLRHAKVVVGQ